MVSAILEPVTKIDKLWIHGSKLARCLGTASVCIRSVAGRSSDIASLQWL